MARPIDPRRGSELPQARLSESQAREILALVEQRNAIKEQLIGLTNHALAEQFGVHRRTIEKLVSGETWGHIGAGEYGAPRTKTERRMGRTRQHEFKVGDVVADARILDVWEREVPAWRGSMPQSHRLMYRVQCVQCGDERAIGYRALLDRRRNHRTGCLSCRMMDQRERARAGHSERITDPALAVALGAWR